MNKYLVTVIVEADFEYATLRNLKYTIKAENEDSAKELTMTMLHKQKEIYGYDLTITDVLCLGKVKFS